MKRDSTLLVIREIQTKTIMKYHTTIRMAKIVKTLSAGKDAEQVDHSHSPSRNIK